MGCTNHPERDARFTCSRCRRNFCVECVTWQEGFLLCRQCHLGPPKMVTEGTKPAGIVPAWEGRDSLLDLDAIFATIKAVLLSPGRTFSGMKTDGGLAAPLTYAVLLGTIGTLFSLLWQPVQFSLLPLLGVPENLGPPAVPGAILLTTALASPLLITVGIFLSAGIAHISLILTRSARLPFEATFRVYCYANGSVALLQVIPFCGGITAIAWSAVLYLIGVAAVHRISTTRAMLALSLPLIVCCSCAGVILATVASSAPLSLAQFHLTLRCPFHAITGLPCPTCGGIRALASLARLQVCRAFWLNPLVAAGAVSCVPGALFLATLRLRGGSNTNLLGKRNIPAPELVITALVAVNWLYLVLVGR